MSRVFALAGGLCFVGSLIFFAVSYGWRFDETHPWSWPDAWQPALVDVGLFTAFALHHSMFARLNLRAWVERHAPPGLERSLYVWLASLLFFAVCLAWQPVPGVAWQTSGLAAAVLGAAQAVGAVLAVASARRLDTLSLAGVRQAFEARHPAGAPAPVPEPRLDAGPYRFVRHPIYLGWFLMVWCPPVMTGTRLLFAAISCLYLVLAIPFEERDLGRTFGASYGRYVDRVKWKLVPGIY